MNKDEKEALGLFANPVGYLRLFQNFSFGTGSHKSCGFSG
jgi:hypothetical protein